MTRLYSPPGVGRSKLDRDIPLSTWCNEDTHERIRSFCKETGAPLSDVQEAVANLLASSPAWRELLKEETLRVQNANRKNPALIAVIEPATSKEVELSPEEVYQHLDPTIKEVQSREQVVSHFSGLAKQEPITLEKLEREEDKAIEIQYQRELDTAKERATHYDGDALRGKTKVGINDRRYAAEVTAAEKKKAREDKARELYREKRRELLGKATTLLTPQLKQSGDPRLQRQYEGRSHWSTMGGYRKSDIAAADLLAPKDTS